MTDAHEVPQGASKVVHITVRSRRVLGDGTARTQVDVPCPLRGREMTLEHCSVCSRLQTLVVTPTGRGTSLMCLMPADLDTSPGADSAGPSAVISQIMTAHVICVRPDLPVSELGVVFLETGISGAPVVDEEGKAIGMVSKTDLVRLAWDPEAPQGEPVRVADIMMPLALCLPAQESVAKAAALMAFEGVHRVPVLGASGQVVGIVSSLDVLRWIARQHGYVVGD